MKQFWKKIGAMALMVAVVGGAATAAVVAGIDPSGNGTQSNVTVSNGAGGAELGGYQQFGIRMAALTIEPEDFAANGVSEAAESAYQITATVEPEDASDKTVTWSVAWKDPASEWATGKTVTDYVTVTASEDTLTGTVACLQAFGEQIVVNVVSNDNADATASCTVDYRKKVKSLSFRINSTDFNSSVETASFTTGFDTFFALDGATVTLRSYSDYTIDDTFYYERFTLVNSELIEKLREDTGLDITAATDINKSKLKVNQLFAGVDLTDAATYNTVVSWLNENSQDMPLFSFTSVLSSNYSTTTHTWQVYWTNDSVTVKAENVTLGDSSLVF